MHGRNVNQFLWTAALARDSGWTRIAMRITAALDSDCMDRDLPPPPGLNGRTLSRMTAARFVQSLPASVRSHQGFANAIGSAMAEALQEVKAAIAAADKKRRDLLRLGTTGTGTGTRSASGASRR